MNANDITIEQEIDRMVYMLDRGDRDEALKLLEIAGTSRGRAFVLSAVAESLT